MRPTSPIFAMLLTLTVPACVGPPPPSASRGPVVDASDAWASLRQGLPGTWVATNGSGREVVVSYRLVSHGSALLETFGASPSAQTVSVYHPDGRALMLTHYCAQGNQPRLRAIEASPGHVVFRQIDATNVSDDQSVLRDLVFELGPDTLRRTEIYRAHDGSLETTVLHFVRRPAP